MKSKIIVFSIFLLFCAARLGADVYGLESAGENTAPENVTSTPSEQAAVRSLPQVYLNAIGIEIAMPGRIIPGISYSRYLSRDLFLTVFGGLIADQAGVEVFTSINAHKMFYDFVYAGLGFSAIFDRENSALIGLANPSLGLMAMISPEITFYAEATAWIFKLRTNPGTQTLNDNTTLVFKAGVKYYFSWLDPLPDLKEMTQ